jgi:hypothetical protein
MMNIFRSLALLFAGALASVIGGVLFSPPPPRKELLILLLSVLVALLVFYGSGAFSKVWHRFNLWRRDKNKFLAYKIGILTDMEKDTKNSEIFSWTDISPQVWKEELNCHAKGNKIRIKTKLIKVTNNFDSYVAILNPYGGVYPEHDLKNHETLDKIFKYVNNGGLFINVADIPGYWAYDPKLKRRLDATPANYSTVVTPNGILNITSRDFSRTPFIEKLGLLVYDSKGSGLEKWSVDFEKEFNRFDKSIGEITVYRVVEVKSNVQAILKPKQFYKPNLFQIEKTTPFLLANYGEGNFLLLLTFFSNENPRHIVLKEILAKIIVMLITNGDKIFERSDSNAKPS